MDKDGFQLGDIVADSFTGFTGIATGRASYIGATDRVQIQPYRVVDKDGSEKLPKAEWFEESRVTLVKSAI